MANFNLNSKHLKELTEDWGIHPEIATHNFETMENKTRIAEVLKKSQHKGNPGIQIRYHNPLTGEPLDYCRFKEDKRENSRYQYLSPKNQEPDAFFPIRDKKEAWEKVLQNRKLPIFLVDEELKAAYLASLGKPAVAVIPDKNSNDLPSSVRQYISSERPIRICLDSEQKDFKKRLLQLINLIRKYGGNEKRIRIANWKHKIESDKLSACAVTVEEWRSKQNKDLNPDYEWDEVFEQMLRLDLTITNPAEKEGYQEKLAKKIGLSLKTLKQRYLQDERHHPEIINRKGSDYLKDFDITEQNWIIADLIDSQKIIMLYAKAGTGKTQLAYTLGKAVVTGTDWCGLPVRKGKVLIIQSDEGENQTKKALSKMGYPSNDDLRVMHNWRLNSIQQLHQVVNEFRPDLIIIDSLSEVNQGSGYEIVDFAFSQCIRLLRDIVSSHDVSIILIHHENKKGDFLGTTGILNRIDDEWHLIRENNGEIQLKIGEIKSRSGSSRTVRLERDPKTLLFFYINAVDAQGEELETEKVRRFYLENPGQPYPKSELTEDEIEKFTERGLLSVDHTKDAVVVDVEAEEIVDGGESRLVEPPTEPPPLPEAS